MGGTPFLHGFVVDYGKSKKKQKNGCFGGTGHVRKPPDPKQLSKHLRTTGPRHWTPSRGHRRRPVATSG